MVLWEELCQLVLDEALSDLCSVEQAAPRINNID